MQDIVIANLGTGNLHSVRKAVEYVSDDATVVVSDSPEAIGNAGYLVLPGQGAIGTWVRQLAENPELEKAIRFRLENGPVLGICLGLQALFDSSDENGGVKGLGILGGNVRHFTDAHAAKQAESGITSEGSRLKIPHMGWNQVVHTSSHPLWQGITDQSRFYFVHSYFVTAENAGEIAGECDYGVRFTAAAARNNLFATQFHPEKSQQAGLQLLKNFINWNGVH